MLKIIFTVTMILYLIFIFICFIMYFPRFRCWNYAFKKQVKYKNDKKNKFAILVPARNESQVINELFTSLNNQTYDRELFDTYVIVKESNDPTIKMCEKELNTISYVVPNQTCKTDALDTCIKNILKDNKEYDAYIIVDADCMLDNKFLEEMNNQMARGRQVIVSRKVNKNYLSKNKKIKKLSGDMNCLVWPLMDSLGSKYKSDNNIVCNCITTGLLIREDVIKELGGWPYKETLTEDIEFTKDCVLRDITTDYCDFAKIYCEESEKLSVTNKRRRRWLTGIIDSETCYKPRYDKAKLNKRQFRDVYYVLVIPRVSYAFCGISVVFSFINFILTIIFKLLNNNIYKFLLIQGILPLLLIYIVFFTCSLHCILAYGKDYKVSLLRKIIVAILHPFFYSLYIFIGADAIFTEKERKWDAIDRINFNKNKEHDYKTIIKEFFSKFSKEENNE